MQTIVDVFLVPSGFVAFVIMVGLGAFVYLKSPRSRLHRFFTIFAFSVACWSVGSSFENVIRDEAAALRALRLCYLSAAFLPAVFLQFSLLVTGQLASRRGWVRIAYLVSCAFAVLTQTPLLIPRLRLIEPFAFRISDPGPAYPWFVAFFGVCLIGGLRAMHGAVQRLTGHERRQMQYLFVSHVVAFMAGIEYFVRVFRLVDFPPVDDYILVLYFLIFAYAVLKHQLLDIHVVIRRSLVYSVLIAILTASYLVIVLLVEHGFQGMVGYRSFLASLAVAFLIAIGFTPLRNWIQTLVDRALFKATPAELAQQREQLLVEVRKADQHKALATLAAGLAHEIKNPLAAIKTFTEFLPEKAHDPEFLATFQRIVGQELDKMQYLVANLLSFAKPLPPKREALDLASLVTETCQLLQADCLKRHVHLQLQLPGSLPIEGDRTQLRQALLNLLLNSLDAMDHGGQLTLAASQTNGACVLTITDTGCGIPPESLKRLGEPFFTTKRAGTGLGLSVVQGILQEHGGRLHISSEVGRGTTVTLTVPAVEDNQG